MREIARVRAREKKKEKERIMGDYSIFLNRPGQNEKPANYTEHERAVYYELTITLNSKSPGKQIC